MKKNLLIGLVVALALGLTGSIALAHFSGYEGHMMGPGYGGYCGEENPGTSGRTKLLTEKETEAILRNYIGPNPNLKVGDVRDKGNYFEGEIFTKENSLVSKFTIDKRTGWVQPQY